MLPASFFKKNRDRFSALLPENSIAIFFSGREIRKSADVMYPFFANRNYYYLTGLEEPNAVLAAVRQPDTVEWTLFVEKVDATYARWFGERLTVDEILMRSMLTVSDSSERFWTWFLDHIEPWRTTIYLDLHRYSDTDPDSWAEALGKRLCAMFDHVQVQSSHPLMERLRMVKEDAEIACMRQGIDVARECFLRMMAVASPGITEYQLKAEAEYAAAYANVRDMAFQPIITTGKNNFCIHYSAYDAVIQPGDLLLCDMGLNYHGVCCDISRCWPVDNWFSPVQEKFYRCALDTSDAFFALIHPGMQMREVYRMQHRLMRRMIVEHGIAKTEEEAKSFIWHGGAHHIGFDNHDEVMIEREPENLLEKNMVFAIDIGIYSPSDGVGLRIEDDCLVTESGCSNLTEQIPRKLEDLRDVLTNR